MYSKGNLSKLPKMAELSPKAMAAFRAWDKVALEEGAIPKQYKELIAIGVALTTQCPIALTSTGGKPWRLGPTSNS